MTEEKSSINYKEIPRFEFVTEEVEDIQCDTYHELKMNTKNRERWRAADNNQREKFRVRMRRSFTNVFFPIIHEHKPVAILF